MHQQRLARLRARRGRRGRRTKSGRRSGTPRLPRTTSHPACGARRPRAARCARRSRPSAPTRARGRPTAKPRDARCRLRVTTPATSPPGMNGKGGFTWYLPCTIRMSKKLQPAAFTSMPSWPGPTTGSGNSRTASSAGSIQRSTTMARMAIPPRWPMLAWRPDARRARSRATSTSPRSARTSRFSRRSAPRARSVGCGRIRCRAR